MPLYLRPADIGYLAALAGPRQIPSAFRPGPLARVRYYRHFIYIYMMSIARLVLDRAPDPIDREIDFSSLRGAYLRPTPYVLLRRRYRSYARA